MTTPVPVLIVGPSGVGKNAVIDRILPLFPELQSYKTTTSRSPRPGEQKYHYVSRDEFQQLIDRGELLEWEETHGNLYGTERRRIEEVLQAGKFPVPISSVDYRGAESYKHVYPGTLVIFLTFESLSQLPARLRRTRPGITEDEVATRLATAKEEMVAADQFDHVVVNREGKLNETVEAVAKILEDSLGLKRSPSASLGMKGGT